VRNFHPDSDRAMNNFRGVVRREIYFLSMPLHAWKIRGRAVRARYQELKKSEMASRSSLRSLQASRLSQIIHYAYKTCSFYRDRLNSLGISPSDIKDVDDLRKLPLLSKADVRANLTTGLRPSCFESLNTLKIVTSGSTGEPFTVFADREQLEIRFASTIRALEMTGWCFGDRQARLWHQSLGMSKTQVFRERFDAWLMRRRFIPAFEISPRNIQTFIADLEAHDPVLLDGYAESLNFLASYLKNGGKSELKPRAVMSSAQALPKSTRDVIESSLNTRVFDKYGSREFSGIAYECTEHAGHHVVDECYIVEILVDGRPALPGETGEVVITDFFNLATPLIRYRIGDLATAVDNSQGCRCGRAHSMIGEIQGRTQAIVHCSNGTWIPGTFFAHFFKDYDDIIRTFQVHQRMKGSFSLRIIKGDNFSQRRLERMRKHLAEYVGPTEIGIEFVDEIPLVRTGKRSPVISEVGEDFQEVDQANLFRRTS